MSREAGLWNNEDGQGMVEYSLVIALVSILCIVALLAFAKALLGRYNSTSNQIVDAFNTKS